MKLPDQVKQTLDDYDALFKSSGVLSDGLAYFEESAAKAGALMLDNLINVATIIAVDETGLAEGPVKEWLTDFAYKVGDVNKTVLDMVNSHSLDKNALLSISEQVYVEHFNMVNT